MTNHTWLNRITALAVALCSCATEVFAQQGWSENVTRVSLPDTIVDHDLAVDASGNAIALLRDLYGGIHAAHRDTSTGAWGAPIQLAQGGSDMHIVAAPSGDATAIWIAFTGTTTTVLRSARYTAATRSWAAPIDIMPMDVSPSSGQIDAVADPSGNVFVAWSQPLPLSHSVAHVSRFDAGTAAWSVPRALAPSQQGWGTPEVAVDGHGNAAVLWSQINGAVREVLSARYEAAVGGWGDSVRVSATGENGSGHRVAADPAGNVLAIWATDLGIVRTARYRVASTTWGQARSLSSADEAGGVSDVVVDLSGNAVAVWTTRPPGLDINFVRGALYTAATDAWSTPVDIERRGDLAGDVHVLADRYGDITVVWNRDTSDDDLPFIHAIRYVPATGRASPVEVLSLVEARYPRIGGDAAGNVLVTWLRNARVGGLTSRLMESRAWVASPAAPGIASVQAGAGTLALGLTPPVTSEPSFAPTTYEYSLDDGATWTARTPASTVSPLRIGGLTNDASYIVRLRAVNGAGPGAPSAAVTAVPTAAPDPPTNLRVTAQAGNTLTLAWIPPAAGLPPASYVLEGGVQPGEVLASIPAGGPTPVPSFTFSAPTGAYYIRMHAVAGAAWSQPSNEIRIFVNVPMPPAAPTNLLGMVNGTALALSWMNPSGGTPSTGLWLNVTGAIATTLPLPVTETFTYPDVPPGVYTFSLSASNAGGTSAPSNSVSLTFPSPCTGMPGAPTNLQAWTVGRTIFVAWSPPVSGAAVTGYTVHVSGSYVGSFVTAGRSLSGAAAPGSYVLSVTANNVCGDGPPTPAQTVVIP